MVGRRHVMLAICAGLPALQQAQDSYAPQRARMVAEQIAHRGVRNPDVLRVMRATPRHLFVPIEVRTLAYGDHPLAIGYGATISQPYVVALMTELLAPGKSDRVLEIGTGSGYQAAILAQLAREVYTIELVPELAASAERRLRELGHRNVTVRAGDGYKGWPERAPFERIILTAAPPDVPAELVKQLAAGGRLVAPVGAPSDQELIIVEKDQKGSVRRRPAGPVMFLPMIPGRK